MFEVNSRNARARCEICPKLTIKTLQRCQWRRSGVVIVNFEQICSSVSVDAGECRQGSLCLQLHYFQAALQRDSNLFIVLGLQIRKFELWDLLLFVLMPSPLVFLDLISTTCLKELSSRSENQLFWESWKIPRKYVIQIYMELLKFYVIKGLYQEYSLGIFQNFQNSSSSKHMRRDCILKLLQVVRVTLSP